jgi:Ran GTPase-activating protein (RanGAP) involved in mRNA processing and transport
MKSLVNLNLDYNSNISSAGVAALAKGLRSNNTLKRLSLRYCGLDQHSGEPLSQILSSPTIAINVLNLAGNQLGGKGLSQMCPGLRANSTIQKLDLSDNNILSTEEGFEGITDFSVVLRDHKSLTEVNLLFNTIGVDGGLALVDGIEDNKQISSFVVDTSLPPDIYTALTRMTSKGKGKKKKSKKKKKK